jgi:hypothetical protein
MKLLTRDTRVRLATPGVIASRAFVTGLVVCALLLVFSCAPPSPEEQVRQRIDRAEAAVRGQDLDALGEMVSERYRDEAGNGKREALALLRYQFHQHESLHLLTQVRSVQLTEPGLVEAVVLVAAADVDIGDVRRLESIPADLIRFELIFAEEDGGEWRVLEADWRRVRPVDFL